MAFTWALNPVGSWDVIIGRDGKLVKIYGTQEVRQRIIITLKHMYAEYWLRPTAGLPYYSTDANQFQILGSKDYKTVAMLLRSAVLDVPGVISLISLDYTTPRTSNNRSMSVSMQVEVQGQRGPEIINIVHALEIPSTIPPGSVLMGDSLILFGSDTLVFGG